MVIACPPSKVVTQTIHDRIISPHGPITVTIPAPPLLWMVPPCSLDESWQAPNRVWAGTLLVQVRSPSCTSKDEAMLEAGFSRQDKMMALCTSALSHQPISTTTRSGAADHECAPRYYVQRMRSVPFLNRWICQKPAGPMEYLLAC